MSIINAIFFGLVQGFTEFFPLSSSAHLVVFGNLFGVSSGPYNYKLFTVFIHFGTIIAAIIMCWNDIADMIYELAIMRSAEYTKKRYPALKLLYLAFIATLPLIPGLLFFKKFDILYYSTWFIGVAVILNGVLLLIADKIPNCNKGFGQMSAIDALVVGFGQLCSVIPGLSRTGVTTGTAMTTGLKRDSSYKFAVILSIPASFGANVIHLVEAFSDGVEWSMIPTCLVGMACSLISGIAAIKIMQYICKNDSFRGFSYYCWVAGVLFIILTMIF